jgi:hypothetical protein
VRIALKSSTEDSRVDIYHLRIYQASAVVSDIRDLKEHILTKLLLNVRGFLNPIMTPVAFSVVAGADRR